MLVTEWEWCKQFQKKCQAQEIGKYWQSKWKSFKTGMEYEHRHNTSKKDKPASKRSMLSELGSVYDPLGFVAPFLVHVRRIIQILCEQ